jgi:hypothetical protein
LDSEQARLVTDVFLEDPTMTPRKTQPADAEKDTSLSPADRAIDWLRPRLAAASKEDLVALLESGKRF